MNRSSRFRLCIFLACALLTATRGYSLSPKQEFFNIRLYQLKTKEQQDRVEKFLQTAFLPALHRLGIARVGVFRAADNDTAVLRRIYVLIPFHSLEDFVRLAASLEKDKQYLEDGKDYLDADYKEPAYARIESILLQAFPGMPELQAPEAIRSFPASERIYELRSYEGPSEKYFVNKVKMFNDGGEIGFFNKLGFNAVFYASVLAGSHMPNLMYMVSFENMDSRMRHWKAFGDDPFWKKLSAMPEYQNNVSHIDVVYLHSTEFSDL